MRKLLWWVAGSLLFATSKLLAQPILVPANESSKQARPRLPAKSAPADSLWFFSILVDQDAFFPKKNEDRTYTMGFGLSAASPEYSNLFLFKSVDLLDVVAGAVWRKLSKGSQGYAPDAWHQGAYRSYSSLTVSGTAFTPDSLASVAPIPGDRPYAFLLGLTSQRLSENTASTLAVSSEATVGVLGLNLGRNVQRFIHAQMRGCCKDSPKDPKGWGNQVSSGGEPTVRYAVGVEQRIFKVSANVPKLRTDIGSDLKWGGKIHLGTYTGLDLQSTLRLGHLRSSTLRFSSLPLGAVTRNSGQAKVSAEYLIFVTGRARVVGYNGLLQGQFRRDVSTPFVSADSISRFIGEAELGASVRVPIGATHGISTTVNFPAIRTSDIKGPFARTHYWASVYFSVF